MLNPDPTVDPAEPVESEARLERSPRKSMPFRVWATLIGGALLAAWGTLLLGIIGFVLATKDLGEGRSTQLLLGGIVIAVAPALLGGILLSVGLRMRRSTLSQDSPE